MRSRTTIPLPDGWARNSINTSIYRGDGLLTVGEFQFGAYYEDAQAIVLLRRRLADGQLDIARLQAPVSVKDAHNGISLGCDHDGFLHLSYNQHGSRLSYVQSLRPYDISQWSAAQAMTGVWEDSVTYPYFLTPGTSVQPLLFFYRRGTAIAGDLHLKIFDTPSRVWRDIPAPILAGSQLQPWTCGPYINRPIVDHFGRLHLFFTWRTMSFGSAQLVNNHNLDYARSLDSGLSWQASNGQPLALPITPVNGETVLGTPPGSNLMNQCGAATDSAGRPFVTTYVGGRDGIRLLLIWHDGTAWRQRTFAGLHVGFELKGRGTLRLPISRPELVLDRSNRAWLILRHESVRHRLVALRLDPPEYDFGSAKTFLLCSRDLGFAEPVIDRRRLGQDGLLSMYLQRTDQGDHEALGDRHTSPAFIADWSLDDAKPAVDEGFHD